MRAAQRSAGRSPLAKSVVGTSSLLACLAAVLSALAPPAGARLADAAHHRRHSRHAVRSAAEGGCPIFPADNPLNEEVAGLPASPNSQAYVESIGLSAHLHPDFGNNPAYGIPYEVVGADQPKVPVKFTAYRSESDPGPYPVPADAAIEGGGKKGKGDKHVLVVQEGSCVDYELYKAARNAKTGGWKAQAGAVFDLRSNALRPEGWTSADAAGLPIFPLLARYQEVSSGTIDHALRVTVPRSQRGYIHPATHFASSSTDPALPPMGLRLRLKATYPLSGFTGQALVIMEALKRYGLIVADNGSPWYITGAPSPGWDEASLEQLKQVPGSSFEAVDTGPISASP
ncbi:MAG TPA: hypothetical protein VN618_10765 [Solirubrobacteraceae bacterium]|nr:hypothetical protein [Solirubrobacteraceae bacterium]